MEVLKKLEVFNFYVATYLKIYNSTKLNILYSEHCTLCIFK